jgi:hypothetical protein
MGGRVVKFGLAGPGDPPYSAKISKTVADLEFYR